jgi:hypothetical protein
MADIKLGNSITIKDQAALDLHKIMLEAMRSRESEILHFIGFFLPAIVGFFAIGWLKGGESAVPAKILLPAVSAVTILILFFGAWYALALSYNYRYIQLVTWSLQEHLGVTQFQPEWKPKPFQYGNLQFFNFAPEILRTQLLLFIALIIAAAILFSFAGISLMCTLHWSSYALVWGEAICVLSIICWLGFSMYPKKYNTYLRQVLKQENNSKSNNRIKADAG